MTPADFLLQDCTIRNCFIACGGCGRGVQVDPRLIMPRHKQRHPERTTLCATHTDASASHLTRRKPQPMYPTDARDERSSGVLSRAKFPEFKLPSRLNLRERGGPERRRHPRRSAARGRTATVCTTRMTWARCMRNGGSVNSERPASPSSERQANAGQTHSYTQGARVAFAMPDAVRVRPTSCACEGAGSVIITLTDVGLGET